jgi:Carboxypeptidase regulatory-like domain
MIRILAWLIVCLGMCVSASAQGGATGAVQGTVEDKSGGVIAGAEVRIIDQSTGSKVRIEVTNEQGVFRAILLPTGTYNVEVRAKGFTTGKLSGVAVRVTETTQLKMTLEIGKLEETVEVKTQVTEVETNTSTTGESLSSGTIDNLPLPTRNVQQLLTLSSGATTDLTAAGQLGRGDIRLNVNGQREGYNNVQIEGISVSDYNVGELTNSPLPNPDAIEQFKVQTSLYDATQGRNGGGNVNAVLRGGTQQFHGSAFEYFRNDVLNANDFFFNANQQPRPVVKQNVFGASLGGPIGSGGKEGFFFLNYEGTRQRSGLSPGTFISSNFPILPADRSSGSLAAAFSSAATPNCPAVTLTAGQIDPVVEKLLTFQSPQFTGSPNGFLFPSLPGTPGINITEIPQTGGGVFCLATPKTAPFAISKPGKFTDNQFTSGYDRTFGGGSDVFRARFFFSNFKSLLPFGAGNLGSQFGAAISPGDLDFPVLLPVHDRFLTLAESHTFSPSLINDFRFGWVRIANDTDNVQVVGLNDLGISRPNSNFTTDIYRFILAASFQLGPTPAANIHSLQNNFSFVDTLGWNVGRHVLRFGGQVDRIYLDKNYPQLFNGMATFVPTFGVSDFQNFLMGAPVITGSGSGVTTHEYRINNFAAFFQDDFKVTKKLTLNLGLRWELDGGVSDALNHVGNLDRRLAEQGLDPYLFPVGVNKLNIPGLVGTASPTLRKNGYASDWGPRVGFAYDPFGKGKTSIRAGYGIYYEREDNGTVDNFGFSSPFLAGSFGPAPPGSLGNLPAFSILPPAGVLSPGFVPQFGTFTGFTVNGTMTPTNDSTQTPNFSGNSEFVIALEAPQHFVSPSAQQWNLTVQQEILNGWVASVGYVGTKGTHLREVSTPIQPFLVSAQNPVTIPGINCDGTKTGANPQCVISQNTVANAAARSRILGLSPSGMQCFCNDANSIYHALQGSLTRRYKGFYFQAAYTYSKTIDEVSNDTTAFNTVIDDQTNLRFTRGPSDFDRTHRFSLSYVYALPFFNGAEGLKHTLLAGWSVDGIVTVQSGRPFSVVDSAGGSAFTPIGPDQSTASFAPGMTAASAITSGSATSRLGQYLNPAAFLPAPVVGPDGSTGYGNTGRNIFRGPYEQNWDFSLGKNFAVTEKQKIIFRSEFFNLFNHPNFANPSFVDVSGPNFGAITSTVGNPRIIQLVLRYEF